MAENSAKKVTIIESLSFLEAQKGIYNGLQNFHYLIKGNTPVKQEIFLVSILKYNSISYICLF